MSGRSMELVSLTVTADHLDKMACQSIEAWCRDLLKEQPALLLWEGRESAIYEIGGIVGEGRPDEEWDAQSDDWIASNLVSLRVYEAYDRARIGTDTFRSSTVIDVQVCCTAAGKMTATDEVMREYAREQEVLGTEFSLCSPGVYYHYVYQGEKRVGWLKCLAPEDMRWMFSTSDADLFALQYKHYAPNLADALIDLIQDIRKQQGAV